MTRALHDYYNRDPERPQVRYNTREGDPNLPALIPFADIYDHALLDGRRITPTTRSRRNKAGSSIIQAYFGNEPLAGEVHAIFLHRQPGVPSSEETLLIEVAWMKESGFTPLDDDDTGFVWHQFPELGINTWEYEAYEDPEEEDSHPLIIPLNEVHCQISRGTLDHTDPKLWITTTMDRVSKSSHVKCRELKRIDSTPPHLVHTNSEK
ncbi:hypothetical protein DFH07DRAFT_730266 [Mycena maculata]|uniref:Uncharacterized protein n=1 Tax=Mycena maculata TaxID=230809 RepID=A0AAD7K6J3_9AGAR|nr:hypothetical protein DFH07DRAFT_730266 [Mycena maculata]